MPMLTRQKFTVRGNGFFPIDMLRYDHCYPSTEKDSAMIIDSFFHQRLSREWEVNLMTNSSKPNVLTKERWESFGWKIVNVGPVERVR
jgi:hypothetical protein